MPTSPLEAEDSVTDELGQPLLSQHDDKDLMNDGDEEIVSQLLSTNERSNRNRLQRRFGNPRRLKFIGVISFALMLWMGLFASIWCTYSCDLYNVNYTTGGVQLSITGIGIRSYQKEVEVVDDNNTQQHDNTDNNNSPPKMKKVCVDYGGGNKHAEIASMKEFFPTDSKIQTYSILAPSFYFAAGLSLLLFAFILYAYPVEGYPITCLTSLVVGAGLLLLNAGIFHSLSLNGLLHSYENNNSSSATSPLCNPAYSTCSLGSGGRWAAYAIFSSLSCSLVICVATYFVGYSH